MKRLLIVLCAALIAGNAFSMQGLEQKHKNLISDVLQIVLHYDSEGKIPQVQKNVYSKKKDDFSYDMKLLNRVGWFILSYHQGRHMLNLIECYEIRPGEGRARRNKLFLPEHLQDEGIYGAISRQLVSFVERKYKEQLERKKQREEEKRQREEEKKQREERLQFLKNEGFFLYPEMFCKVVE